MEAIEMLLEIKFQENHLMLIFNPIAHGKVTDE
jgi:hypothetical protein